MRGAHKNETDSPLYKKPKGNPSWLQRFFGCEFYKLIFSLGNQRGGSLDDAWGLVQMRAIQMVCKWLVTQICLAASWDHLSRRFSCQDLQYVLICLVCGQVGCKRLVGLGLQAKHYKAFLGIIEKLAIRQHNWFIDSKCVDSWSP